MYQESTAYRTTTADTMRPSTEIVHEVVKLVNNPATSIARLAATISKDKTLTRMILQKANAPSYGFPGRVTNVNFALVLLGFNALRETLRQTLVSAAFRNLVGAVFSYEDLWNHSLATGLLACAVAKQTRRCNPEEALIAGLLHDVGFFILHQQHPARTGNQQTGDPIVSKSHLNIPRDAMSHEEVGSAAAHQWNLPPAIGEAIRYHHQPERATLNPALTAIVHLADVLSVRTCWGFSEDQSNSTLHEEVLPLLGLDESIFSKQSLDQLLMQVERELNTVPRFEEFVRSIRTSIIDELEHMEPALKIVMALHYVEGFSWSEIAQLLHQREEEVQKMHEQALEYLRRAIKDSL